MFKNKQVTKTKIQIRQINDIDGNSYKIYDVLIKDNLGQWKHKKETYFNLNDALRLNKGVEIEDLTK